MEYLKYPFWINIANKQLYTGNVIKLMNCHDDSILNIPCSKKSKKATDICEKFKHGAIHINISMTIIVQPRRLPKIIPMKKAMSLFSYFVIKWHYQRKGKIKINFWLLYFCYEKDRNWIKKKLFGQIVLNLN